MLKLAGAAAGAATFGSVVHAQQSGSDPEPSFVLEQGDRCVELTPLTGEQTVEEFYDYRYPTDEYDSISGADGGSFSSAGTTDLQEDATSILFLYDGPEGLSLVVVHGRLDGDDDGGVVTFAFEGMPEDASWVVKDDLYTVDGVPFDTNYDQWDDDGTIQQADWAYVGGRTDGGAARGLGEEFEFTISPAFNDDAVLDIEEIYGGGGPIEDWKALSADGDSPERISLDMDAPVTIRTGACEEPADDEPTDTPDDDPTDDPTDTPDEPVDDPVDEPVDEPTDEPTDTPDDPVDEPTGGDDPEAC